MFRLHCLAFKWHSQTNPTSQPLQPSNAEQGAWTKDMLGSSWQSGWRRTCTPQLENKMHHGKWRDSKPKPAQTTKEKTNWRCRHQLRLETSAESPKSLSNINMGTKPRISKQLCAFQHFLLHMTLGEAILGFPTNSPNESLTKSYILGGKA